MKLGEMVDGGMVTLQVSYSNAVHEFSSRVLGQKNEIMILSGAVAKNRKLRMPDGEGINIICQILNHLYIWKHVPIETLQYKGKIYYRVMNTDIESCIYNRRGAYRLSINKDMDIGVYEEGAPVEKHVSIKDISESGICFVTKEDLPLQKKVHMYYETDNGAYNMSGVIVRKVFDSTTERFSYGCCMEAFNTELGGFIMKEQMKRRRVTA